MIEIWQPRWKDRSVLLACYKVSDGDNYIKFTKTPSMEGVYKVSGSVVRKCNTTTNGKIKCYVVPLDELRKLDDV